MKRKALGRGLSALLSERQAEQVTESVAEKKRIETIDVNSIKANQWQPRTRFDDEALDELSESIRSQGVLQPLLVRRDPQDPTGYQLIAGERRLRASRKAGLDAVPCIILEAKETEALEIALVENVQRSDLSPVDEARAYKQLTERFSLTQEDIALRVGKSRESVANLMRLLQLPNSVLDLLDEGAISAGHAKVLLSLKDPGRQQKLAEQIHDEQWSVRRLEDELRQGGTAPSIPQQKPQKQEKEPDLFVRDLQTKLQDQFQTKVDVKMKGKSKGRIEIQFYDLDQLDSLLKQWKIQL